MDLTNDIDLRINTLFDSHIPGHSDKNYLLTAVNKSAATYYEDPKHPNQAYFSFIDTSSVENLAAYLSDFWKDLGTPEFSPMAQELSELAFLLSADHESQSEDVSPFVYTMY